MYIHLYIVELADLMQRLMHVWEIIDNSIHMYCYQPISSKLNLKLPVIS